MFIHLFILNTESKKSLNDRNVLIKVLKYVVWTNNLKFFKLV